jgi:hypothetical protein
MDIFAESVKDLIGTGTFKVPVRTDGFQEILQLIVMLYKYKLFICFYENENTYLF